MNFNLSNEIAYILIPNNTPQNIIDGYNEILNPETQMDLKVFERKLWFLCRA
jgi:hypothetical protein